MGLKLFSRRGPAVQSTVPNPTKKKWRYLIWSIVILVVGVIGWVGITGAIALKNITAKNNNDGPSFISNAGSLKPSDINVEGASRINILLAGIGGANHAGGNLTDTLQILSIDPVNKTMAMLSIPRDLYVTKPSGVKGKINEVNTDGAAYCKKFGCASGVDQGGAAMEATIGNLLGIKLNYFVRIDFSGFQEAVDTLGGVQVYVDKPLNDPFYPNDKTNGYSPLYISAGQHNFDGATALKYARSRETTSDFDRARRQQQILTAIMSKALSLNTLGNPEKVTSLLTTLGNNLRTDLSVSDILTLINLSKQLDTSKTTSVVLDTSPTSPLESLSDPRAGYIIIPRKGLNDFSEVQNYVASVLKEPYVLKEAATVAIVNASGKPTLGESVKTLLTSLGYNVTSLTSSPITQSLTTISKSSDKPYSFSLLQKRFSASIVSNKDSTANITLTLGSKYVLK